MSLKRVVAEINLDKLHHNYKEIEKCLEQDSRIIAVLKTDAYGNGAVPLAKELEGYDSLFGFALASAEEALSLRKEGIKKPLLILGYTFNEDFERLITEEVRLNVFQSDSLDEIQKTVQNMKRRGVNKKAIVHIKVDTGMSRIGIFPDENGLKLIQKAAGMPEIEMEGIFTHFYGADEKDKSSAIRQFETFHCFINKISEMGIQIPIVHCANSAAILEMKQTHYHMVRAGIILYGLWPSGEVNKEKTVLKPILSLKSSLVFIKKISRGTAISYGGTYIAPNDMILGTVPVGYGDGYPRSLSNKGYVLVRGKKAPIVGRICMDQFMIDLTHIPEAVKGDEVILVGESREDHITLDELGELSGRFNYEFSCDLGERIPRIYVKNNK